MYIFVAQIVHLGLDKDILVKHTMCIIKNSLLVNIVGKKIILQNILARNIGWPFPMTSIQSCITRGKLEHLFLPQQCECQLPQLAFAFHVAIKNSWIFDHRASTHMSDTSNLSSHLFISYNNVNIFILDRNSCLI